jgi:hypothetical protein
MQSRRLMSRQQTMRSQYNNYEAAVPYVTGPFTRQQTMRSRISNNYEAAGPYVTGPFTRQQTMRSQISNNYEAAGPDESSRMISDPCVN